MTATILLCLRRASLAWALCLGSVVILAPPSVGVGVAQGKTKKKGKSKKKG